MVVSKQVLGSASIQSDWESGGSTSEITISCDVLLFYSHEKLYHFTRPLVPVT